MAETPSAEDLQALLDDAPPLRCSDDDCPRDVKWVAVCPSCAYEWPWCSLCRAVLNDVTAVLIARNAPLQNCGKCGAVTPHELVWRAR